MDVESWKNKERAVSMPNGMWTTLRGILLMTANERKAEAETWRKLAQETAEDGTPKYQNAVKNYQFWIRLQADVDEILERIGI